MSLADARHYDEALAAYRPPPLTAAQRAQQARERQARTLKRMVDAVRNRATMDGNVTRRDLLDQGFTEAEIDQHARAAIDAAQLERIVA